MRPTIVCIAIHVILWAFRLRFSDAVELHVNFTYCTLYMTKNIVDQFYFRAPLIAVSFCITFQSNWKLWIAYGCCCQCLSLFVACWPEVIFSFFFFVENSAKSDHFECDASSFCNNNPKTYVNNFNISHFTHVWLTIVDEIVARNVMQTNIKTSAISFCWKQIKESHWIDSYNSRKKNEGKTDDTKYQMNILMLFDTWFIFFNDLYFTMFHFLFHI